MREGQDILKNKCVAIAGLVGVCDNHLITLVGYLFLVGMPPVSFRYYPFVLKNRWWGNY